MLCIKFRDEVKETEECNASIDHRPIQPMILDGAYIALKNQVIKAERRILKELGFCVHVKHPHKVDPLQ